MSDIYKQHEAAFAKVSAYVIAKDGERVATIAFKFPRDGAGRLYAYVHWFGVQMVRGWASGYGYDKRSAAASVAAKKLHAVIQSELAHEPTASRHDAINAIKLYDALRPDDGMTWDRRLRDAGFDVWQAV